MYKEILLEFRIFKNGLIRLVTPLFVVIPLLFLFDNYLQMVHSALLGHGQRVLGVARMNELLCRQLKVVFSVRNASNLFKLNIVTTSFLHYIVHVIDYLFYP